MLKLAGLFYYMMEEVFVDKIKFNKPALNVYKQIELLKSRGLIINNTKFAKDILSNITYYRLSAYMKFFQNEEKFKQGTKFEDIVDLYNFDKELKSLIFDNIRVIEITLRTKICLQMCSNYGPHWFYNENNFRNQKAYKKTLEILENEKGQKKDTFIKYYLEKYSEPELPPFWMIAEVLSLGDLSKILDGLNSHDIKQITKSIIPEYYISPVLTNWIHVLATIRNICAHHSRLWNRILKIKFSQPQKVIEWKENQVKNNNIFSVCFVIALLMKHHPYNRFEEELHELFKKYKKIDITKMGFPNNWINFNL